VINISNGTCYELLKKQAEDRSSENSMYVMEVTVCCKQQYIYISTLLLFDHHYHYFLFIFVF